MIMMMAKYVRGRVWRILKLSQIPCQLPSPDSMPRILSNSSVLTSYQWQHTIWWRPKIIDSRKIMIHLLAAIKRYCNYLWMSELLYWLLQNVNATARWRCWSIFFLDAHCQKQWASLGVKFSGEKKDRRWKNRGRSWEVNGRSCEVCGGHGRSVGGHGRSVSGPGRSV